MADSVLVLRRRVSDWTLLSVYLEENHTFEECKAQALANNSEDSNSDILFTVHKLDDQAVSQAFRFLLKQRRVDRYGLSEEVSQLTATISDLTKEVCRLQETVDSRLQKEDAED